MDGMISSLISDNGIGFDPEMPAAGQGLSNLRARTLLLNGTLTMVRKSKTSSISETGMIIHLKAPLKTEAGLNSSLTSSLNTGHDLDASLNNDTTNSPNNGTNGDFNKDYGTERVPGHTFNSYR